MRKFSEHRLLSEEGAGLARLWHHMEESDCVIMTAFRRKFSRQENRDRNNFLLFDIVKQFGGPIRLYGGYNEEILDEDGKGTGEFEHVREESFFIPALHNDQGNLDYCLDLGHKYDQDSIIYIYHPDERHNVESPKQEAAGTTIIEAALVGTTDGRWIDRGEFNNVGQITLASVTQKLENLYSQIRRKRFAFMEPSDAKSVDEAYKRLMEPDGLANAYGKREFLKKYENFS